MKVALLDISNLVTAPEKIDLVRDANEDVKLFESFTEAQIYKKNNSMENVHLICLDFNASVYMASEHLIYKHKHMEL
jgi:hypothetical protein